MSNKVCAKCGVGTQFKAVVRRPAVVEVLADGTANIIQEGKKFKFEIVGCVHCGETITDADVVELVTCSNCGKAVSPAELEDGKCIDCITAERTDLAGLSANDYIKRILELEKKLNAKQGPKIENKVEAATNPAPAVEDKKEDVPAATTTEKTEEVKKPGSSRSSRSKAKAEATQSAVAEDPVAEVAKTTTATTAAEVGSLTAPVLSDEDPF